MQVPSASFAVSEVIAKRKKPCTDEKYVKQAALVLVKTACFDLPVKDEIIRRITDVSLSGPTVAYRTADIAKYIVQQLLYKKKKSRNTTCFLLLLMNQQKSVTLLSYVHVYS